MKSKKAAVKRTAGAPEAEEVNPNPKGVAPPPSHEEIAHLAYALWEEGGREHGQADAYWLRAERELRGLDPQTPAR